MNNDTNGQTITEFLLARIAEDEELAQAATGSDWKHESGSGDVRVLDGPSLMDYPDMVDQDAEHVARWDPKRVLAECAAKRAIIASCSDVDDMHDEYAVGLRDDTLGALSAIYSEHPDYQKEWAL